MREAQRSGTYVSPVASAARVRDVAERWHDEQVHQRASSRAKIRTALTSRSCRRSGTEPARTSTADESTTALVLDVSASGVRVLLHTRLEVGAVLQLAFPVSSGPALAMAAEVVWTEAAETGWRHGCRFVALSESATESLFRFVLLTQGEQRRAALERAQP